MLNATGYRQILNSTDSVFWVKDRGQILVLDEQRQEMLVLRGVEAAVWGWLVLDHPYEKMVRSLTVMLGASAEEAEQCLSTIIQKLISAGFLDIEIG